MGIFVMLFERKARNFNHLCNGMLFALLLSTSSLQFGPNLEAPKKLECKNSELEQGMIPFLRGRVFHVTKQKTFDQICCSGWIYSHSQAAFSLTPAPAE